MCFKTQELSVTLIQDCKGLILAHKGYLKLSSVFINVPASVHLCAHLSLPLLQRGASILHCLDNNRPNTSEMKTGQGGWE